MKKLAADGHDQFGGMAAPGGMAALGGNARGVRFAQVAAPPPPNAKDLDWYFDNLAAAATNKKAVLGQLAANNATLTETCIILGLT